MDLTGNLSKQSGRPAPSLNARGRAFSALPPGGQIHSPELALSAMLNILEGHLPPAVQEMPDSSVTTVSFTERTLGLGNRRGNARAGSFAVLSLKGGRIDAVVRFQFWHSTPAGVDSLVSDLQQNLLAARTELWNAGFLIINQKDTSLAEHIPALSAWRKFTDFQVLFEYHYNDLDGAESLITRIPIHTHPEEFDSPALETTTIRDEIIRWDHHSAEPLVVTGKSFSPTVVTGLAGLAYLPVGFSGGNVSLARLDLDNSQIPTAYPDMVSFLTATTDPVHPERHGQVVFATLSDFIDAFAPAGDSVPLGDLDEDGTPDEYRPGVLAFDRPLRLAGPREQLRISYEMSAFETPAVVYLRVGLRRIG